MIARVEATRIDGISSILRLAAGDQDVVLGGDRCVTGLRRFADAFDAVTDLQIIDAAGHRICATAKEPVSTAKIEGNDRQDWQKSGFFLQTGVDPRRQSKVIHAVLPLSGGATAIVATLGPGWLQNALPANAGAGAAAAMIVDVKGRIVMSDGQLQVSALAISAPGQNAIDIVDAGGRHWHYAVAPIMPDLAASTPLFIAYAVRQSPSFGAAWWQARLGLFLPLFAVLLAAGALWRGADRVILCWLRHLGIMSTAVQAGDFSARTGPFSAAPHEFRGLAHAFQDIGHTVCNGQSELRAIAAREQVLTREVHHRVKNNLQIVASLLELQLGQVRAGPGRAVLEQTRLRVAVLVLVHQLFYATGNTVQVSSARLLGEVCVLVAADERAVSRVTLATDIDDQPIELDAAVPLAMWLLETLSNAYRHAFPEPRGGSIAIRFGTVDDGLALSVSDDGIGIGDAPRGIGLRWIFGIARQLGGQTESRAVAAGTMLVLTFPAPHATNRAAAMAGHLAEPSTSAAV